LDKRQYYFSGIGFKCKNPSSTLYLGIAQANYSFTTTRQNTAKHVVREILPKA